MAKKVLFWGLSLFLCLPAAAQDWQPHYKQAQELLHNGDAEKAHIEAKACLAAYQQAQGAANTVYASILRLLQNTSYSLGEFEQGLDYSQKEITIRESKTDTLLAGAYQQAAQFHQQLGHFHDAIEVLKRAREILQQYFKDTEAPVVECNLLIGINHYLNDDDTQAYSTLSDALNPVHPALPDESAAGLLYLGMVNLDRERPTEAIRLISQSKELYDKLGYTESMENTLVLFNLGVAHYRARKFDQAESFYHQAQTLAEKLEATEDDVYLKILNERSVNLQSMGREDLAKQFLDKVKNHPGGELAYAESLSNRASILQNQGAFEQALALYQEALKLFDKNTKEGLIAYAATQENLAVLYSEMGEKEKASTAIAESLSSFEKLYGGSHVRMASIHSKRGQIVYRAFDYATARQDYEKALAILSGMSNPPQKERAIAMNGLARCYQALGDFKQADSWYKQVLNLYSPEEAGDVNYLNTLNAYASLQQDQGEWNEARNLTVQVKNVLARDAASHPRLLATALENASIINLRLGFTADAKNQLDSAMAIVEKSGIGTLEYGLINMSYGRYFQTVGEYTKSETAYRHANETILKLKGANSTMYAQSQNSLGLLLQTMGNFPAAEPLFQNSLRIYEQTSGKSNREYTTVLQNMASLYQLEERYDKAGPLFEQALEIDRGVLGENHPLFATAQQNLATFYQKTGRQKDALPLLESVLKTIEKATGKNTASYATAVSNLAAVYQDNKNFESAEKYWKESVDVRKRILGESHPDYARSLYGLAALYHATGRLDLARNFYNTVVTSYQKQIKDFFPALSEKEKSAFYSKIKPAFDAYQDFCVEMIFKKPETSKEMIEALYNLQLGTKAILLNASNKVRTRILNGDNQELKDLYQQWLSNKETIVKLVNLSAEERKAQTVDVVALEVETNEIEKKLSSKSSLFSDALEKTDFTWREVHHALKPGEAAIEIIRIRKKFIADSIVYVGLVVKQDAPEPTMLVWQYGAKMEGRFFKYHRNHIKHQQMDDLSYKIFWQPLAAKVTSSETIYLSCDGVFNKINPATILNPEDQKWVLETKTIKVLSNTRELAEKQPTALTQKRAGKIFGFPDYNLSQADAASAKHRTFSHYYGFDADEIPPLPATEKEASIISQLLMSANWTVASFTKMQATEENFKILDSPGVLHVATHGFFLSDLDASDELASDETSAITKNPLFRSGLILAGASADRTGKAEDGILTAYEAMNLSLDQTDLVALSACETGLGEVRNGEGVYGLQRAFSVAGAKAVLMSLWQVDDAATQELMTNFYSHWLKGGDKYMAFRQAQLELKAKYPQPYYWGAFVLSGR
jgi:CHAT domain-containing protein